MTWRGVAPIVHLLDRVYETGVRLSPRAVPSHCRPSRTLSIAPEMEPRDPSRTRVDYFLRAALARLRKRG